MFYTTYLLEIIALLTGLVLFNRIRPVIYRTIVLILFLTVLNEGFAHFKLYEHWGLQKNLLYNIFFFIQVIIFSMIYYTVYTGWRLKRIAAGIGLGTISLSLFFLLYNGITVFNQFYLITIILGILLLACVYLYALQAKQRVYHLKQDPFFWFSCALIVGNIFFFLFVNMLFVDSFRKDPNSREIFATLNTIGNMLYYSFIIISMLCSLRLPRLAGT